MNKKFFFLFLVLIILLAGAIVVFRSDQSDVPDGRVETDTKGNVTVTMTPKGFAPKQVVIKRGETVTWVNRDRIPRWPASDFHPVHTSYPNSSVFKCGEENQEGNFDACQSIAPEASWSFTFEELGTWHYHDHLWPGFVGTVEVQESIILK